MIFASWNILNNSKIPRHASQTLRQQQIIDEINKIYRPRSKFVLFLCEATSISVIEAISIKTGLVQVGQPIHYRGNQSELSVFLVDPITAIGATTEAISVKKEPENSVLLLRTKELTIVGCHLPWRLVWHMRSKNNHMSTVLYETPDVFMGDFNAMPFFPTRLRAKSQYTEAHAANRPAFPSPFYRGKNIHWWFPSINIDAIYLKPHFKVNTLGQSLNHASDHPLIWADLELQ